MSDLTVGGVAAPRYIKSEGTPNLQSVTEAREMSWISKFFFPYIISTQEFDNTDIQLTLDGDEIIIKEREDD